MKQSAPSDSVIFDVNEEGVTLRFSLGALEALVSAVGEKARRGGVRPAPTIDPDQNSAQGLKLDSLLMSIKDAASILGVSRPTIYNLLKYNAIVAVKIGSRTMIPTQALRDYAASLKTYGPGTPSEGRVKPVLPSHAAPSGHRKLKFRAVMALTGLSRQQLFVRRNAGTFPPGVTLSSGVLGWDRADVDAWIANPAGYGAEPES